MKDSLERLSEEHVAVWLDDLSRSRIASGNLAELIERRHVVGVTTNPSIFQKAISEGAGYGGQLSELARRKVTAEEAVRIVTTADVREAAEAMRSVFEASGGLDGLVSIEVDPRLAGDDQAMLAEAKQLRGIVDRPNVLIKIPATRAGLSAVTEAVACGISVNVTLIFSPERYREVADAYLAGLEAARSEGLNLASIRSVASFFVSRIDVEVDRRLDALGGPEAADLRGRAAVASARLAYEAYEQIFSSRRWVELAREGAARQRPLWASTGVKDPAYKATKYVAELVAPDSVSTMPDATLDAVQADNCAIVGNTIKGTYGQAQADLLAVEELGVSLQEVSQLLERQGIEKFVSDWCSLLEAVDAKLVRKAASGL